MSQTTESRRHDDSIDEVDPLQYILSCRRTPHRPQRIGAGSRPHTSPSRLRKEIVHGRANVIGKWHDVIEEFERQKYVTERDQQASKEE
jgi:hypothetical protein